MEAAYIVITTLAVMVLLCFVFLCINAVVVAKKMKEYEMDNEQSNNE